MLTRFFRIRIPQIRLLTTRNLHIEEEYFEDFSVLPQEKGAEPEKKKGAEPERPLLPEDFLAGVVDALAEQRAKSIFVVKADETTPFSHRIICSVFNARQASAISENLRSILKMDYGHVKKTTRRSNGWFVSEIERIQIHVMSDECRERYDLETIWAGDSRILDELDEEKLKILLPPKR